MTRKTFLKIGHRGARAYAVENTIESFKKAIEMGVNAIELDVRRTKDKKLVVIHDDNLKKVFGVDALVGELEIGEIKDSTNGQVPTFYEALDFLKDKIETILVELKEPGCEKDVIKEIEEAGLLERVIIVSFHEKALENVRKVNKKVLVGFIYTSHKKPIETALKVKANYVLPLYRFTHTKDVEKAHQAGLRVIVWTVNTIVEAKAMRKKDVDGIATDMPDIFRK